VILPFGKHRGLDTSDPEVDVGYLSWLEEQEWLAEPLRQDIQAELQRRQGDRPGMGKVVKRGW